MASQARDRGRDGSLRQRLLRDIADRHANAKAKAKHETPLIKTISRKKIKTLPRRRRRRPIIARPYTRDQRLRPDDIIIHQLSDSQQFGRALRLFSRLPLIPGLAGVAPRVRRQDHDRERLQIQLQYPGHGMWRIIDRLHSQGEWLFPQLRVHEIHQLRDTLLNDIRILCASHIAFSSDISFLRIAQLQTPVPLVIPLLDIFDLDICTKQDTDTIDWLEFERDTVRKVEAQFQVFELLAQFESPTQSERQSNTELDPVYTLSILEANPPRCRTWSLVIQHVGKYTPELAHYTMGQIAAYLYGIQKRISIPSYYPCTELASYSNVVSHMLRLSTPDEGVQTNISLLADRAYLRVLYAAILVHAYASVIKEDFSKGLLQLDCPRLVEPYTSSEHFDLITVAYREAQEATQTLYKAGGKLGREAKYLLRSVDLPEQNSL
ncbi:hypothetical protein GGR51DRAFT_532591 [Nemania sp. FL0031]|nr:hypothetical protein GGR51DRAFT_532591 [Nemania sp. FL0031]